MTEIDRTTDEGSRPMVRIRGLCKAFGATTVLAGIDLDIHQGEVVVILGPSGSGKSTLLRCVNHIEPIDSGIVVVNGALIGYRYDGTRIRRLRERAIARQRCTIGMVFQQFNLFPHMTVLENVTDAPSASSVRPAPTHGPMRGGCLTAPASPTNWTHTPGSSPAANSNGSRSPALSRCARR